MNVDGGMGNVEVIGKILSIITFNLNFYMKFSKFLMVFSNLSFMSNSNLQRLFKSKKLEQVLLTENANVKREIRLHLLKICFHLQIRVQVDYSRLYTLLLGVGWNFYK